MTAEKARRASGWLRVWALVGVLYGLLVAVLVASSWPPAESRIRTYIAKDNDSGAISSFEFYGEPSDAQIQRVIQRQPADKANAVSNGKYLSTDPNAGTRIGDDVTGLMVKPDWFALSATGEPVVISVSVEGRRVYFPGSTPEYEMTEAVNRYVDGPWPERRESLAGGFAWWAGPMLFLLALGWGIGWVVRGFRGTSR